MIKKLNIIKHKFTIIICLAVLILSVTRGSNLPKITVQNIDKIVHILFYFAIGAAMFLDYFLENHKFSFNRKNLLVFLLFPLIYGAIIEVIQGFLPHRTAEWLDLLSDFIGGLLATVFFYFFRKKITFFLINHINIVHRIG